jgi:hypothetical protein
MEVEFNRGTALRRTFRGSAGRRSCYPTSTGTLRPRRRREVIERTGEGIPVSGVNVKSR